MSHDDAADPARTGVADGEQPPRNRLARLVVSWDDRTVVTWWAVVAAVAGSLSALDPILGFPGADLGWRLVTRATELWVVAGVVLIALLPLRRSGWLRTVPTAPRMLVVVMAAALVVSQHGLGEVDLYPFPEWGMYSGATERISYSQYLLARDGAVDAGSHVRLQETVPTGMRPFMRRLDEHIELAAAGDSDAIDLVGEVFARVVPPDQQAAHDAVHVEWCEIRSPSSTRPVHCEESLTVPLPGATR